MITTTILSRLKDLKYGVEDINGIIHVNIDGEDTGYLIGYRGETMEALQMIATTVGNKGNKNSDVKLLLLDILMFQWPNKQFNKYKKYEV